MGRRSYRKLCFCSAKPGSVCHHWEKEPPPALNGHPTQLEGLTQQNSRFSGKSPPPKYITASYQRLFKSKNYTTLKKKKKLILPLPLLYKLIKNIWKSRAIFWLAVFACFKVVWQSLLDKKEWMCVLHPKIIKICKYGKIYVNSSFGYGNVPSGVWDPQHKVICQILYKIAAFFCIYDFCLFSHPSM